MERIWGLNLLGAALKRQHEKSGNIEDLERAIQCHRDALTLNSNCIVDCVNSLHSLGVTMLKRFECCGEVDDVDAANSAYGTPSGWRGQVALPVPISSATLVVHSRCALNL
jgi:hypothetical protein